MKTQNKKIAMFVGMILLAGSTASAHIHHHGCWGPVRDERLVSRTVTIAGACQQTEKLELVRTSQSYPLIGNLEVDAWKGAYGLPKHEHKVYQIDMYNCDGDLQESYTTTADVDFVQEFAVDNPNLHGDVKTSFAANAPMTDTEAAQALALAKQKCEAASFSKN